MKIHLALALLSILSTLQLVNTTPIRSLWIEKESELSRGHSQIIHQLTDPILPHYGIVEHTKIQPCPTKVPFWMEYWKEHRLFGVCWKWSYSGCAVREQVTRQCLQEISRALDYEVEFVEIKDPKMRQKIQQACRASKSARQNQNRDHGHLVFRSCASSSTHLGWSANEENTIEIYQDTLPKKIIAHHVHHELGHRLFGLWHTHQDPDLKHRLTIQVNNPDHNWIPRKEEEIIRFGRMPLWGPLTSRMSYGSGLLSFPGQSGLEFYAPASEDTWKRTQEHVWITMGFLCPWMDLMKWIADPEASKVMKDEAFKQCRKNLPAKKGIEKVSHLIFDSLAPAFDFMTGNPVRLDAREQRLYRQIRRHQVAKAADPSRISE